MPVTVTPQSPAQMRRVAWSLLIALMDDIDTGGDGAATSRKLPQLLASQLDHPRDITCLMVVLLDLSAELWLEAHGDLAAAREHAASIALDMAAT